MTQRLQDFSVTASKFVEVCQSKECLNLDHCVIQKQTNGTVFKIWYFYNTLIIAASLRKEAMQLDSVTGSTHSDSYFEE